MVIWAVGLIYILSLLVLLLLLGLIDLLDLRLVAVLALLLLGLLLILRVGDLLLVRLLHVKLDREADELGVLLHQVLEAALLQEFGLVLLQRQDELRAALDVAVRLLLVLHHRERP